MSNLPEIDLPVAEDLTDRLSRVVALAIASATLVAALVGYLQSAASSANGDAARRAQQLGVESLASLLREQQAAQVEVQTYALVEEERTRAASSLASSFYLGERPDAARLQAEQVVQDQLVGQIERLTSIRRDSPDGPGNDPIFPYRFLARSSEESIRLTALQDAANEVSAGWAQHESVYTAILAMLAVTLYLFGLALTVPAQRIRRGFAGIGLVLVVLAGGWAALTAASPPQAAPDEAAAEFAAGTVALNAATRREDYQQAVTHLTRAIELRPTFARAYDRRADAIFAAGSPQRAGGYLSIASPQALEESTRDLRRAEELGLQSANLYGSLGFQLYLHGLEQGRQDLLDQGIEATRQAIDHDPNDPAIRFNLAVTELASGRVDQARRAYDEGAQRTIFSDVEAGTLRNNPAYEEAVVAGALTDLELLGARRSDLAPSVGEMKSRIVTFVSRKTLEPPPARQLTVGEITLNVFPGQVQWIAPIQGYDPAQDVISEQWYYNDPENLGWQVLPNVSGVVEPGVANDGTSRFSLRPYLTTTPVPQCVPDGRYRLELYANGVVIGQAEQTTDFGDMTPFVARELRAAVCHPQDWQRSESDFPGLVSGYQNADRTRGVFLMRFGVPGSRQVDAGTLAASILDVAVTGATFALPQPATVNPDKPVEERYFLGLEGGRWRDYDYPDGAVRAGAGVDDQGAVIVAIIYGPPDYFEGGESFEIIDSLTRL